MTLLTICKALTPAALADLAALQGAEWLKFLAISWRLWAAAQHRLLVVAPAAAGLQACDEHLEVMVVLLKVSSKVEPGSGSYDS